MNTAEIDTPTARLARFTEQGLNLDDGERLADRLVIRDRESDDRAVWMECTHLQRSGVAVRERDVQLSGDFVKLKQRCDGFTQSIDFQGGINGQAMGGFSSGRQGGKRTTGDMWALDVRKVQRSGRLTLGQSFNWQWSRNCEPMASFKLNICTFTPT